MLLRQYALFYQMMSLLNKSIVVALVMACLVALPLHAQQNENVSPEVQAAVKEAKALMDAGKYEAANQTFRNILDSKQVIPSELCYYFAETLFMIGQYKNSENFAAKYIELTGKGGDYYKEVIDLQELLANRVDDILACQLCDRNGYRYENCHVCSSTGQLTSQCYYCKGNGLITCQTCLGEGVQIGNTQFGTKTYTTCQICQGNGKHTCPVCTGTKELTNNCYHCAGTGRESSADLCNHTEHQHKLKPAPSNK